MRRVRGAVPGVLSVTLAVAAAAALAMAAGCAKPEIIQSQAGPDLGRLARPAGSAEGVSRTFAVGHSVEGRPITVEIFGSGVQPVLVIGGIHGDEPQGADVARRLATFLRGSSGSAGGATVAILASANPDGLARRSRANANGVDINRNLPAANWKAGGRLGHDSGGEAPAAEPETQALIRAVEMLKPGRIISLHATARPPCNNFDGPAEALARRAAARNGYAIVASIGYPTPGSLGSWAGVDRGIPTVTIEMPAERSGDDCWLDNRDALLDILRPDIR